AIEESEDGSQGSAAEAGGDVEAAKEAMEQ
ncbi:hypothetical protein Tco_1366302, partial [Tanacetum coccineum]